MSGSRKLRFEVVVQVDGDERGPDRRFIENALVDTLNHGYNDFAVDVQQSSNSMAEDYPFTSQEYWHSVMSSAEEHIKSSSRKTARTVVKNNRLVSHYPRAVIYHCRNGMAGDGHQEYVFDRAAYESNEMLYQLAKAALYNDVADVAERILEAEKNLGEASDVLSDMTWSKNVKFNFPYQKGVRDPVTRNYTLNHLGYGEYEFIDPEGNSFEVISPSVKFEAPYDEREQNFDYQPKAMTLETWLNNFCAKQEREREMAADGA
jgi:hypothetical protein